MILNQVALKRQSVVFVLLWLIILAGLSSYFSLPREAEPDITIPYIFVNTTYEGVAPEDIEKLVTIPLERKLKGLADVEELRSTSKDGESAIAIKFLPSVVIDDALQKVRDKVDQASGDLPGDLEDDPLVSEANFSDMPTMQIVLSGPFSLKRLKVFAEDLEDKLESVQGVLDARLMGGLEREIHVEFDLDRIGAYNVPFSALVNSVQKGNVNMPGGSMNIGDARYQVRVPEDFQTPSEINNIVAFVRDGKPVYLRDIAEIQDHYKDPVTRSRMNGQNAVTLQIIKRSGENIIEVNKGVTVALEEAKKFLPPTLILDVVGDRAEDVRMMVSDLENNILTGLVLVLAVVFLFIGGRSAFFVSIAIPLSMLITFVLLRLLDITLNMVVLFSLILALGMLVDNGIVIVENIYRHMQEGKSRFQAAMDGTNEVAWPVITSTLTTVGAFFPMIFWPGIMGEFMSYLPRTVILALFGSLFVALVINPVFSSRFQTAAPAKFMDNGEEKITGARRIYLGMLNWSLDHRLIILGISVVMFFASIFAFGTYGKGVEFFPKAEPKRANVNIKAPVGTNLDATDRFMRVIERVGEEYKDVRFVIANTGSGSGGTFGGGGTGTHLGAVTLDFKPIADREIQSSDIINEVRDRLTAMITGAEVRVEEEKGGPPTGAPVNLEVYGKDMRELGVIVDNIRAVMRDIPGPVDIKDDFVSGKPEIQIRVDKERAALLGLDTYTIAYTIKAAINGVKVGVFREGKDEYDILTKLPESERQSIKALRRITVSGADGEPIPLTSVASVKLASGLGAINHKDQKRVVTVSANVEGRLANDVIRELDVRLKEMSWPRGYSYTFSGEQEEQRKASEFLTEAFVATIFLIFLVLVAQFNSMATPFIILTSVLLSLIGVFGGLLICGMPFGVVMTGVGVISLAGVVVNNAIVLIDYFEQLRAKGMKTREALVKAGLTRFRPVLLTAITTILGLLPMAVGISFDFFTFSFITKSDSTEWWSPMAVAVIFGLFVATMLTLLVVPVLCSLKEGAKARWEKLTNKKAQEQNDTEAVLKESIEESEKRKGADSAPGDAA
ncbi:efflux RND transporter permease subunit [Halodesulfovibrio sp. MK-HDV]|jgi:multidrug efflux pump|uniref:efflux RND transporter permease subunit n=1 Tax=Halodesulfovibrio sp. MK-HDV TaxID=2599925 RepID=UPI001368422B|nr:efflux RND transporter permease subunit [Halodesulfovibrio sp. MK-HDV]KAF1075304.1 Cobalt-zinc-cadmium resistance protein CzcA [Halodesulfovibrio sp. MK-HDV]